jgi:hypothetical protein
MFSRIARWLPRKRKPHRAESPKDHGERTALVKRETAVRASTNWRAIVTAPIEQLCEAPSADTVRYAFDLYAQEVYAPFAEREARMASRLSDIRACFATLVARAPELVEAALAEHPQVFADIVRLQKRGRP